MSNMTKNALSASLVRLMASKRLDRITVKEISEECGLNRHTFYYHFRDIYDLLNWTCIRVFEEANRSIRTLTWPERFTKLMWVLLEHRTMALNVMRSVPREQCLAFLEDRVEEWIVPALNAQLKDDRDAGLIAATCRTLLSATMLRWVDGGMSETPEAVTERMLYVTKRMPDAIPGAPLVRP